jgi:hypothetical protein
MALTADLSTTTVTGTYVDIEGNPISGSVRFSPQSIIKDTDQNQIIINSPVTVALDNNGSFSVVLPVTDDTDVAPIPFAYQVEEIFSGGRTFFITLPGGGTGTEDIADIAPAVTQAESLNFVTVAQYNALNVRYLAAQANYDQIDDIAGTIAQAESYASQASASASGVTKASHQFMLMGL